MNSLHDSALFHCIFITTGAYRPELSNQRVRNRWEIRIAGCSINRYPSQPEPTTAASITRQTKKLSNTLPGIGPASIHIRPIAERTKTWERYTEYEISPRNRIVFGTDTRLPFSKAITETKRAPYREPTKTALKRPAFSRTSNIYKSGIPTDTSSIIIDKAQKAETILPILLKKKIAARAPMMNSSE
jgi:hypothetical protein